MKVNSAQLLCMKIYLIKNKNLEILRNLINDITKRTIMKKALNNIPVPNANELMLKVLLDEKK